MVLHQLTRVDYGTNLLFCRMKSFDEAAVSFYASSCWNNLLEDLSATKSADVFKF